ncbi:MAG: helix-turn-helix transcriptional regulator [Clostridia bacterium]|nr:helix-turn-helix transcriptional regulator [Clostridia bacterium]
MTTVKAVALRVSNLLIERKMTRYQLCRKIAMPEMTLKHILDEDNKRIHFDTMVLLAEGFDMTIQEFINCDLFDHSRLEIN